MITKINKEKLTGLIKSFYNLTGIKVAVYDTEFCEILAYPENDCEFCNLMHERVSSCNACEKSMERLCLKCVKERKVIIETCHAGLNEVIAPLTDGVSVIGYIMFGQITNEKNRSAFLENVVTKCKSYGFNSEYATTLAEKIPYYSSEQLEDATKILAVLASYIVFEKIAYPSDLSASYKVVEYIRANLDKNLTIAHLCQNLYISKTMLYKITKDYMPEGILTFIKHERISKAEHLLLHTDMPISKIAEETGFSNTNYFCTVFKREKGISASKFRSNQIDKR